jgi:hypothetical protein
MGDVDDVEVYAAGPIYDWLQTDAGKWASEHCDDLSWYTMPDPNSFGYIVRLRGSITDQHATEYYLRFGK